MVVLCSDARRARVLGEVRITIGLAVCVDWRVGVVVKILAAVVDGDSRAGRALRGLLRPKGGPDGA